jgi:hypothetical protein
MGRWRSRVQRTCPDEQHRVPAPASNAAASLNEQPPIPPLPPPQHPDQRRLIHKCGERLRYLPSRRPSSTPRGAGRACLSKVEHPMSDRPCPGRPCLLGFAWAKVAGMAPPIPEAGVPAGGVRHRAEWGQQAPDHAGISAVRGFFLSRAVRRAGTDDAAAERRCRRQAVGPALVRRRERSRQGPL